MTYPPINSAESTVTNACQNIRDTKKLRMNESSTPTAAAGLSTRSKLRTSNIRVAVRVRPLLPSEKAQNARSIVRVMGKQLIILMDPGVTASDDFLRLNKSKEKRYAFDIGFDENADQRTVYEQATSGVVDGVINGMNACVFTYGATGAGKTFTMLGSYSEPGIMSLTLEELFAKLNSMKDVSQFNIKCSFVEVYNENIRDLLGEGKDLELREDPVKGMCVARVSEIGGLERVEEIMDLLHKGNRNRTTEPTAANVTSSRSHAVLQVVVERTERGQGATSCIQVGKLSLIDLAGSERASVTNNKGIRLLEGANINRSLLALGNCITALADNANGGKGVFVPYRDSKLTRLLKDSLGGNCQTVMITNVSPCNLNYEDTRNTLKYANRAKNIQTEVAVNKTTVTQHISNYNEIIGELKSVVYDLKGKLSAVEKSSESVREASEQWRQELMDNLDERVRLKKSLIDIKTEIGKLNADRLGLQPRMGSLVSSTPRAKTPGGSDEMGEDDGDYDEEDESCQPDDLQSISERLAELRTSKCQIETRIAENAEVMMRMQKELPARVKDEDVCAFLLLLYRNQVLEIEAMDRDDQIEWIHRHNDELLRAKDREVEVLKSQVRLRDEMMNKICTSLALPDDVQRQLEDMKQSLMDVDTELSGFCEIPTSPLGAARVAGLASPRSVIPFSTRFKGMPESLLMASASVKNSPRMHRIPSADGAPPSTADSCKPPPVPGAVTTPRKRTLGKRCPNTTRPAIPNLPAVTVQASGSPYQATSTRRSQTEKPPNSKQGKRLGQLGKSIRTHLSKPVRK